MSDKAKPEIRILSPIEVTAVGGAKIIIITQAYQAWLNAL